MKRQTQLLLLTMTLALVPFAGAQNRDEESIYANPAAAAAVEAGAGALSTVPPPVATYVCATGDCTVAANWTPSNGSAGGTGGVVHAVPPAAAMYVCPTGDCGLASNWVPWSGAGGSGGSGTVTNIATTGPITGGPITTTGTIACPSCVVATTPGAGIAHFAGSTQTVTSSPVALASDVSGNLPNANLASQTANTVLGALTATTPSGLTMPSCSGAASALIWTTGTGFGCNTISAGSAAFSAITTATNTTATMTCGTGCVITTSGTGTITATAVPVGGVSGLGTGVATFLATPSSANLAAAITDETGSGLAVFATSPTLTTPILGVAAATSINKVTITAPATSATLTIANSKTLTVSNTLTLTGTDGTTMTFPGTSDTVVTLGATQTLTLKTLTSPAINSAVINASTIGATTPSTGKFTTLSASGTIDGEAPVTITTGTTATVGAGTFLSGYTMNQEATAATAVTYTLPVAAAGKTYCVGNSNNGTAANTGVITLATSAAGQFLIFTDGTLSATGGNVTSGGAAADFACVVGLDATHWFFKPSSGTWTKH